MSLENKNTAMPVDKKGLSSPVAPARKPTPAPKEEPAAPAPKEEPAAPAPKGEPAAPRRATEVDAGWRGKQPDGKRATEVDAGWRGQQSDGKRATEVDAGWRSRAAGILEPEEVISAASNHFEKIDDFKDAVEKLSELTDSTGKVYRIRSTLSRAGGESIILLCEDPAGEKVVAKVYFEPANSAGSSVSTRSLVLDYMGTEEGRQYTLAVSEIGVVAFGESKYYFEIMPYCANNDLADDGACSFERIVEITRQLNKALHSIHQAGIIHRDIKPENLYEIEGRILLGDFGIAKNGAVGRSNVTEHILGTEGYAAPETRRYIYSEKSDYYSLGVTLATLFEGHFVFDNMNFEMQTIAQESERLPLLRTDPQREQLENLLNGLCRIDAKKRFGYEEVERWLADHNYTGTVLSDGEKWPMAFRMLGEAHWDEQSMFEGITKDGAHWDEAKTMLYTKIIEQFFSSFRTDLAMAARRAEETFRTKDQDKGLAIFLKQLFAPGAIVWKGYTFGGLGELGGKMIATKNPIAYSEILQNQCISHWLAGTEGIEADEQTVRLVNSIEALSLKEPELACYWFGNSFAPKKQLKICQKEVSTIPELINALFSSPKKFYQTDGYNKLMNRSHGAALYGFLFSFGFKEAIDKEWEQLGGKDLFHKSVMLIGLMDTIAQKSGADPSVIRKFFVEYGPMGIATYTRGLVMQEEPVYLPLDSNGRQLLSKISDFKEPASGPIDQLFRAYSPLLEQVERLQQNLTDNPHHILAGSYDQKGVICSDLQGCFAFRIYGRIAPLGFHAQILFSNGGEN